MPLDAPFNSSEMTRSHEGDYSEETLIPVMDALKDIINSPLIDQGCLTVGIIRPGLVGNMIHESNEDQTLADAIEKEVWDLGIALKFSIQFSEEFMEQFYEGEAKERMLAAETLIDPSFGNRWEEFKSLLISGPSTILVMHEPEGTAIETWRSHLGHWNLEANRDPETIRGKFGLTNHNNLVHGSDSPDSVRRELSMIYNELRTLRFFPERLNPDTE